MNRSNKTKTIKITRIYAEQGKSRFEALEIDTALANFAPPAPAMNLSAWFPAEQVQLMLQPPGWVVGNADLLTAVVQLPDGALVK